MASEKVHNIQPLFTQSRRHFVCHDPPKPAKTKYRTRKIPITQAIRQRLDTALKRSHGNYVFTKQTGETFNAANFCNNIWIKAFNKAELPYKVPYCMGQSFAAWALTLKIDMLRLVALMGHRDKKMVFEVYGNYVEGLEQDVMKIRDYFGKDFIAQSPGESRGKNKGNP